jgi:hypothetical protein
MFDRRFVVLSIAILIVGSSISFSQGPDISWSLSIPQINPNYPADMELSSDGDWMIAVNYQKGPDEGFRDSQVIARFTPGGVPVWVTNAEVGEDQKNFTHDIAVADDGLTWVVGEMAVTGGWPYPFVMVIDTDGTVLWSRIYPSQSNPFISRVLPMADGSAIIAGSILNEEEVREAFGARINPGGGLVWLNNYGDMPDGLFTNVILFEDGLLFGGGQNWAQQYYDLFFVHTDMDGNAIWSEIQNVGLIELHGIEVLPDGGFVSLNSVVGLMWLLWFDNMGQLENVLQLDIYRADRQFKSSPLKMMSDGGFAIGGVDGEGNALLLRTDASGTTIWQNTYSNIDPSIEQQISALIMMPDDVIQFCGKKIDNNDATWIVQLDPEGMPGVNGERVMKPFVLQLSAEE